MSDLLDEIWQRVFSHLRLRAPSYNDYLSSGAEQVRLRTLANVCHVSRRFRRLAQPVLYQWVPSLSVSWCSMARTLAERPDLAESVLYAYFDEPGMEEANVRREIDAVIRTNPSV